MNRDRLLQTALLASVGLNLFLLGTLVPRWLASKPPMADKLMMMGPEGPGGPPGPFFAIHRMMDELPEADAKIMKEHFGSDMDKFMEKAKSFRGRIDRLRELMRAEPFDAAAMRAELEQAASDRQLMEQAQTDRIMDLLGKLSPEGRRRLAEMRPPRMMMMDRHGPGEPGMPPPPGAIPLDPARAPVAAPPPSPSGG